MDWQVKNIYANDFNIVSTITNNHYLCFSSKDIYTIGLVLLFSATVLTLWSGFNYLIAGLKTFDS